MPGAAAALERVRAICLELPQTTERQSHGMPNWFVGSTPCYACFANDHHHDGRVAIWFMAPPGAQEALIASDPERFFRPAYVGPSGWVGMRLEGRVDWRQVTALLGDAHACAAERKRAKRRR